ncbi:hypothetical protein [Pseudomonas syringae]|uniref:hypothetical protein n=1 Tax=Pseudomonas syringae TaxID=317 RepID=UPI00070AF4B7|nr:hypothetical protein [Pseudomonas syringae]KWS40882.1 hypothetical protein AL060_18290 [Pseudomonas syringae pv. rhaphiolepidis]
MNDAEPPISSNVSALRFARAVLKMTYPTVSTYEFNTLKNEEIIRERWSASTIYLIVQRPLTYFDNVVLDDTYLRFEIADGDKPSVPCRINLVAAGLCEAGEQIDITVGFYSRTPNFEQPFRNVGGFQLYRENGEFIVWWSPQKLLYEMLIKGLEVEIAEGFDPHLFLDFKVHYIGKSFSQKVWDRLKKHEKMQSILIQEPEVGRAPEALIKLETSLIILQITGVDDIPLLGGSAEHPMAGSDPIVLTVDGNEAAVAEFMTQPHVQLGDEALTREVEAYLINLFKPSYNEILYENYPNIAGGMRSKGYSWTEIEFESVLAFLYTDSFSMVPEVD